MKAFLDLAGIAALFHISQVAYAQSCSAPLYNLCCMNVAPWSSNSGVWGGVCGYTPSNTNELVGARCLVKTGTTCPSGTMPACCTGIVSGQCGLGTRCGVSDPVPPTLSSTTTTTSSTTSTSSTSTSTPSFTPQPIPSPWTTVRSCAPDTASRVFASSTLTLLSNNTPANCIAHCEASGWTHAGVEYGNECYCGNGWAAGYLPNWAPEDQCNVRCPGNAAETCGGGWRIQIYSRPSPVETYEAGWSRAYACAVDDASRIIVANTVVTQLTNNTPANCISHCNASGHTVAGVEYGNECICGGGLRASVQAAPARECAMTCAGNNALKCGDGWRIQIYRKTV